MYYSNQDMLILFSTTYATGDGTIEYRTLNFWALFKTEIVEKTVSRDYRDTNIVDGDGDDVPTPFQ